MEQSQIIIIRRHKISNTYKTGRLASQIQFIFCVVRDELVELKHNIFLKL